MKPTGSASWTMAKVIMLGVPLILLTVNNSFAAPANSNEDQMGFVPSRQQQQVYRSRENPPVVEYNFVPVVPETGIPVDTPLGGVQQQQQQPPVDITSFLNYLWSHSARGNRLRFLPELDSARNELARKRSSYSRYCAFNAVSCFGRKK